MGYAILFDSWIAQIRSKIVKGGNILTKPILTEEDKDLIKAGYKPQLNRSLGFWSSFAASFSFMSVLMGIFANYGYVLKTAGPFGFWIWPIFGFGQLLIAFVFAEMAARFPLTGSLYNWNTKLTTPAVGWMTGWVLLFAYAIGGVGVIAAMLSPLQSLLGQNLDLNFLKSLAIGFIVLQTVINIYGIRLAAFLNKLAVSSEVLVIIVLSIALIFILGVGGQVNTGLLTTIPDNPTPYWPVFLAAVILPAFTIFGFETAADLSEETKNVKKVAPRSIISSVLSAVILGFFFIVVLTLAIPDLKTITASADPISAIIYHYFGLLPTKIVLFFVLIAMFATSLITFTTATRLMFAMARDKRIIGSSLLEKISSYRVPANAALVVMVIQIIVFLTVSGITALYASAILLLAIAYLITVLSFAFKSNKLPPSTTFSLKKWRWPVIILATVGLVVEISILTIPEEFHTSTLIAGGVIAVGVLLYIWMSTSLVKKKP